MVAKRLYVRGELETEQRLQHIDPQFHRLKQHFFLVLLGYSTGGPEGPALYWELILTASNCNKLIPTNWTSCRTGFYHCLTSTTSCERRICTQFNPSTVNGYTLISSTGYTSSLIDGWVEGQYVTYIYISSDYRSEIRETNVKSWC